MVMASHTPTTISTAELAQHLSEILDRVRVHGERFEIAYKGETIATLAPTSAQRGVRLRNIVAQIGDLYIPDDGFADILEEIQASQPKLPEPPVWPS